MAFFNLSFSYVYIQVMYILLLTKIVLAQTVLKFSQLYTFSYVSLTLNPHLSQAIPKIPRGTWGTWYLVVVMVTICVQKPLLFNACLKSVVDCFVSNKNYSHISMNKRDEEICNNTDILLYSYKALSLSQKVAKDNCESSNFAVTSLMHKFASYSSS